MQKNISNTIFTVTLFLICFQGNAQSLTINMMDTTIISQEVFTYDLTVEGFEQISTFQFSMQWDPSVINFVDVFSEELNNLSVNDLFADEGTLVFNWFATTFTGSGLSRSLPDNATLFKMRFLPIGELGDSTTIRITNEPRPIKITQLIGGPNQNQLLTLKDGKGLITLGEKNQLLIIIDVAPVTCFGGNDGKVDLNINNTESISRILWSGPGGFQAEAEDIDSLIAGNYQLQIFDKDNELLISKEIEVSGPKQPLLITSFDVNHISCTGANGTVLVKTSGGEGDLTYRLGSISQTDPMFEIAKPGIYTIEVTDEKGCSNLASFELRAETPVMIDLGEDQTICAGSEVVLEAGDFPVVRWSTGARTASITVRTPGAYGVTVTNAEGCVGSDSVVITAGPSLSIDLGEDQTICAGSEVVLEAGDFPMVQWSSGARTASITVRTPGAYGVTVTNAEGCVGSDSVVITAGSSLSIDLGEDQTICAGSEVVLEAGDFPVVQWSTGARTASITVGTPGVYGVTVTNAEGCVGSDSVVITAGSSLSIDLGEDQTICAGSEVVLEAGNFPMVQWSTGARTASITVRTPGAYGVTVTNAEGCVGSDSVVITAGPPLSIELGEDQTICAGSEVVLEAGDFPVVQWSTGARTASITVRTPGAYGVTVTNAEGCVGSDSVVITAGPPLSIDLGEDQTICAGSEVVLEAGDFPVVQWSTGARTASITVGTPGVYGVTVTSVEGCVASDRVVIESGPPLSIDLSEDQTICAGSEVVLEAGDFPMVRWSTGARTASITVGTPGVYGVTVTSAEGCVASDRVQIHDRSQFDLMIEQDAFMICPGESMALNVNGGTTFQWIDTSGTLNRKDIPNPIATPQYLTSYTVIVDDECQVDTLMTTVDLFEKVTEAGPDTCVIEGSPINLFAIGGQKYEWISGSNIMNDEFSANPRIIPTASQDIFVMIYDENNCVWMDTVRIEVIDLPDVFLPNLITPNGDGQNDVLEFTDLKKYGENTLTVYNRWGVLVYQKLNYMQDDDRFDGRYKNKLLPTGTYFYELSFRSGGFKQTLSIIP